MKHHLKKAEVANGQVVASQAISDDCKWRLTDIYIDEAAFENDCKKLESLIAGAGRFRNTLHEVESIIQCFFYIEEMNWILQKILQYANFQMSLNQAESAATERYAHAQQLMMQLSDAMAYRQPELYANPNAFLDTLEQEPRLAPFLHQIQREREQKVHQLPEEQEVLLTPLSRQLMGADTLFSKLTNADITFPVIQDSAGKEYQLSESVYGNIMFNCTDRALRKAAAVGLRGTYGRYRNTLAQNMDNFVQGCVALAHAHRYKSAKQASLDVSSVPVKVYDALLASVESQLPLAHQAIELRSKALGYTDIATFDTNIPLAKAVKDDKISYQQAQEAILAAVEPLGRRYTSDLKQAFQSRWIDVYPAENKTSGAYSASLSSVHPYVLLNFMNDFDSVSTTAHEMGHAMHQYYSAVSQESAYNSDPTIFTSEVASTANELLLSDWMISHAKTSEEKLYYLSTQLGLLHNTFFQQVMYSEFEDKMYQIVEQGGTLTADTLENLWLETCRRYYGPKMNFIDEDRYAWSRIPHFYYQFYVFQYATSISAACDIIKRIEAKEAGAVDGYLAFLHAGDSLDAVPTLELAGVDVTSAETHAAYYARYAALLKQIDKLLQ